MKKKENFDRSFAKLNEFLNSSPKSELEKTGVIQAFEFTFEAAWKYLQSLAQDAGFECGSPKAAFLCAIQIGLVPAEKETVWAEMLKDRNLTSHTYQAVLLETMFVRIKDEYVPELARLK